MKRSLLLGALAVLLGAGCSSALTSANATPSFTTTFAGLYADQQAIYGRVGVTAAGIQPLGSCRRVGSSAAGPGDDWTCVVQYVDEGTAAAQSFELQVKPDGCWKADGPASAQSVEITRAATGLLVSNPLAEFDGCFDTSWH